MKHWTRVAANQGRLVCGRCGRELPRGTPICQLSIDRVARILIRCEACEGPAPRTLRAVPSDPLEDF
jgi:hypothetical protein